MALFVITSHDLVADNIDELKATFPEAVTEGETLEQHCETEFNCIRSTIFLRAYF